MVYQIIELANTHGGHIDYMEDLIDAFEEYNEGFGMKFQPLSPKHIATPDYEWYKIYEELFFEPDKWKSILERAKRTKDVWIDIFDTYGVSILIQNQHLITGIKFQSSVLYNYDVFKALRQVDLKGLKIILNIAARTIEDIASIIKRIQKDLNPAEIILEFGFQGYPTALDDCGLSKIQHLRDHFNNRLVFADHTDASIDDALWLPVVACMKGVDIIEKHVMLDRETRYDHFSSLTPERYALMIKKINQYKEIEEKEFINRREGVYLKKSMMVPILKENVAKGSLLSTQNDFVYRRTNKLGLNAEEIEAQFSNYSIIAQSLNAGETLEKANFKKANIATIIACRLKSTRLPQKALLKIGKLSSVEFCIARALKFDNVQHTVLATSTEEQDQELRHHIYSPSVIFHTGHPDDVIQRYLSICDELKIDIIIRVTADMPFIDNEICQFLLTEHFKAGADYTVGKTAAVGTNLEIINVQALKKVKQHFSSADYSEYMTWYFQNNPDHFKLHFAELPQELVRNYRLTLDHQEDLDLFNAIHDNFKGTDYNIRDVFEFLDKNEEIAKINSHITLKYKTDKELIDTLNEQTKINV